MILFHPALHIWATRSASIVRCGNYEQMLSQGRKHKKVLFIFSKRLTYLFSPTMFLMGFVFFLSEHWHGCHCFFSFLSQGSHWWSSTIDLYIKFSITVSLFCQLSCGTCRAFCDTGYCKGQYYFILDQRCGYCFSVLCFTLLIVAMLYTWLLCTYIGDTLLWALDMDLGGLQDGQAFGLATFASYYYYYIGYRRSLGYEGQVTSGELDMMTTNRPVLLRSGD